MYPCRKIKMRAETLIVGDCGMNKKERDMSEETRKKTNMI